ncbi:MAG: hypothetical protein KDE59_25135 [Anaerolineales bacterium]|nr:hypothetical protein [Anaerolineales bacterium]
MRHYLWIVTVLIFLAGCRSDSQDATPAELPTLAAIAQGATETATATGTATSLSPSPTWTATAEELPPTWTLTATSPATNTPLPYATSTRRPTFTPWPTQLPTNTALPPTATLPPAATATTGPTSTVAVTEGATSVATLPATATTLPTNTPPPATATSPAPSGGNLLPNPSFEGGWYHINNIPELQIPASWRFEWEEGNNPLDPDPWNAWVRPEVRVLTTDFLPPNEHPLFIWDGTQTVKIFKGTGSISFRLVTEVTLPPGRYRLTVNVFPDLVVGYTASGEKIWAPDPLSGEIRLMGGGSSTGWILPTFGQKNTFTYEFVLGQQQTVTVGAAMRGRWAILNNGWFMDDWSLFRIGNN